MSIIVVLMMVWISSFTVNAQINKKIINDTINQKIIIDTTKNTTQNLMIPQAMMSNQIGQLNNVTTPEAAALINAVKYPVGYNAGKVDVTIPLHVISVGGLDIPITMSYNTKGLKTTEFSRFFGLGWTINVEPTIANVIKGIADVQRSSDQSRYISFSDRRYSSVTKLDYYMSYIKFNIGNWDVYPDEYCYKLPNNSGTFMQVYNYRTDSYQIATVPYDPIKVDTYDYKNFMITDDNGYEYFFSSSITESAIGSDSKVWKVTEIHSPSGQKIYDFSYAAYNTAGKQETVYQVVETTTIQDCLDQGYYLNNRGSDIHDKSSKHVPRIVTGGGYTPNGYVQYPYYKTLYHEGDYDHRWPYTSLEGSHIPEAIASILPVPFSRFMVSTISFDHGSVEFLRESSSVYSEGLLNSIIVKDVAGAIIKRIVFEYNSKSTDLKLLRSVKIYDGSGNNLIDKYTFGYVNEIIPSRRALANWWNYSLGGPDWNSFIPTTPVSVMIYDNTYMRESVIYVGGGSRDTQASKNAMLNKVTNMLGGITEFAYESDRYNKLYREGDPSDPLSPISDYTEHAGGLRIKEIREKESEGGVEYRRVFTYGEPSSDGEGMIRWQIFPELYTSVATRYRGVFDGLVPGPDYTYAIRERTLHSSLFTDPSYGGIPVVYNRVFEEKQAYINGSWVENGSIEYRYDYPEEHGYGSLYNHIMYGGFDRLGKNDDWRWGNLKAKYIFSKEGKLIQEESYEYEFRNPVLASVGFVYQGIYHDFPYESLSGYKSQDSYYGMEMQYKEIYVNGCVRKTSEAIKTYDETTDNYLQVFKTYEYNDQHQPKKIVTTNPLNTVEEQMLYVSDSPSSVNSDIRSVFNSKNINPLVERYVNFGNGKSEKMVNYFYKFPNLTVPQTQIINIHNNSGGGEERIRYHNYDQYKNPIYVTQDGLNTVYIWGYQGRYLLAEIKNATRTDVYYALNNSYPEHFSYATSISPAINNLRNSAYLQNAQVTSYEYDAARGLVTKITDPSGRSLLYSYDFAGRLTTIRDEKGNQIESYEYKIK